jgi:hypothetical protein
MKSGKFKFIFVILLVSFFAECSLFYPPQFYEKLVNKDTNNRGGGPGGGGISEFKKIYIPGTGRINSAIFTNDDLHILAVDTNGSLWSSSDGGNSWSSEVVMATTNLTSICYNGSNIYVTGGLYTCSKISGSWNYFGSGYSMTNYQVLVVSNFGVVGGNGSRLFWTQNSGVATSWMHEADGGVTQIRYGVCLNSMNNKFFSVGSAGDIVFVDQTNLGAVGWVSTNNLGVDLRSICAAPNGNMVTVGVNGAIYYSSDGAAWNNYSLSLGTLNRVYYNSNLNLYYFVGDGGTVRQSIDGINWVSIPGSSFSADDNYFDINGIGSASIISGGDSVDGFVYILK